MTEKASQDTTKGAEASEDAQGAAQSGSATAQGAGPAGRVSSWLSPAPLGPQGKGVRRTITHINVVSAMKMAFMFNVALFCVWFVAMALIYVVLGGAGVWDRLNSLVGDLTGSAGLTGGVYFGVVAGLGLFELVIFTLLAPVAAVIYNSAATILGGVQITLDR